MSKEEKILADIQTKIKEFEKLKGEKEQKKKEKEQIVTLKDLKVLIDKLSQGTAGPEFIQPQQMQQTQSQQKPLSVKQQIAFQLWRDSKATIIVCLIAIILPMVSALIASIPDGAMWALLMAFIGIIYPCFVFVRMVGLQTRLHAKYGLKPLLQFRQQYPMPYQQKKQTKSDEGDLML